MPAEGLFDMHCHIVPFVDDGADSREEAFKIFQMEYQQGVRYIIATPHFRVQMFEKPLSEVRRQFALLKTLGRRVAPDLKLYLGCEFHSNMEMVEMLKNGVVTTMAGSHYVLTEFSQGDSASYIKERVYALLTNGYLPILAHIERYSCLRNDISLVRELTDIGAHMQVNADSLVGREGFGVRRYCNRLLDEGLIDFVGSDCHGTEHRPTHIGEAYDWLVKKAGSQEANRIFIDNPTDILIDAMNRYEF